MAGTLYIVSTPIGNLEDITLRALRVLKSVQLIAAEDTRRTSRLLAHHGIGTPSTSLHEHNERAKARVIVSRLAAGEDVALVTDAGTPAVSDPGSHLIATAIAEGHTVIPIPGPSAVLSALVASGVSGGPFCFAGFAPHRSKARKLWFETFGTVPMPVIVFESPHRITQMLEDIQTNWGERQISMARELTKVHEEVLRGTPKDLRSRLRSVKGEFTLVVSPGESPPQPQQGAVQPPDAWTIQREFSHLTNIERLPRRDAIREIANRHGVRVREIYQQLETIKDLAE